MATNKKEHLQMTATGKEYLWLANNKWGHLLLTTSFNGALTTDHQQKGHLLLTINIRRHLPLATCQCQGALYREPTQKEAFYN